MYVLYGVLEYTQTSQIYKKDYKYNNKQYIIKLSIPQACSVSYIRIFLSFFIYTARGPTFFTIFLYLLKSKKEQVDTSTHNYQKKNFRYDRIWRRIAYIYGDRRSKTHQFINRTPHAFTYMRISRKLCRCTSYFLAFTVIGLPKPCVFRSYACPECGIVWNE